MKNRFLLAACCPLLLCLAMMGGCGTSTSTSTSTDTGNTGTSATADVVSASASSDTASTSAAADASATSVASDAVATGATSATAAAAAQETQILFNGSSTLAPVITKIASDYTEQYGSWSAVDASLPGADIEVFVSSGGSGQGVKAVIDKTADFGMLARAVKDSEKEQVEDPRIYQVGIDALTLAINPENPLAELSDNLSTEQIVKIFSGEYKTWKDLDSSLPEQEIVVITRDINGGAHEVFQEKIMGDVQVSASAIQASSMGELVQDIIDNQWAIGYASFGVVNRNAGKVVTMKVDGVEPSVANIMDGSYIIQRPLLLLGSGEPTPVQQAFLDEILGEAGQATVEDMGFIPMSASGTQTSDAQASSAADAKAAPADSSVQDAAQEKAA